MDDECPICMHENTPLVPVYPCGHRFCAPCRERWLAQHVECALCRQCVVSTDAYVPPPTLTLQLAPERPAGITLSNHRCGVVVRALHAGDEAVRHLQKGDVITHLNGRRVKDHVGAIRLIEAATRHRLEVGVTLRQRTASRRFWWRRKVVVLEEVQALLH